MDDVQVFRKIQNRDPHNYDIANFLSALANLSITFYRTLSPHLNAYFGLMTVINFISNLAKWWERR